MSAYMCRAGDMDARKGRFVLRMRLVLRMRCGGHMMGGLGRCCSGRGVVRFGRLRVRVHGAADESACCREEERGYD